MSVVNVVSIVDHWPLPPTVDAVSLQMALVCDVLLGLGSRSLRRDQRCFGAYAIAGAFCFLARIHRRLARPDPVCRPAFTQDEN
jgi:hypothetical protein